MALTITNIQRAGAAGCQHYRVTVDDGGTMRSAVVTLDDLRSRESWQEMGPVAGLVLLWIRYRLASGATAASLVGAEVAP